MSQTYPQLPPTERLRDSRQKIVDRDEAIRSCFEGTAFPTSDLVVGQLCYRSDEKKLYQLTSLGPAIWHLAFDHNGTAITREEALTLFAAANHVHDDRYATSGHNHNSAYAALGHNHAGIYQPADPDLTAVAGLTTTGLVKRTADGQAATVASTAAGETLLTAADAGAQRTALGLSDAATTTVAAIQAGVSVTGKVDKAGDTMTGQLNGTVFKTTGTNAATGFKIASGADLASFFLRTGTGGGYSTVTINGANIDVTTNCNFAPNCNYQPACNCNCCC